MHTGLNAELTASSKIFESIKLAIRKINFWLYQVLWNVKDSVFVNVSSPL